MSLGCRQNKTFEDIILDFLEKKPDQFIPPFHHLKTALLFTYREEIIYAEWVIWLWSHICWWKNILLYNGYTMQKLLTCAVYKVLSGWVHYYGRHPQFADQRLTDNNALCGYEVLAPCRVCGLWDLTMRHLAISCPIYDQKGQKTQLFFLLLSTISLSPCVMQKKLWKEMQIHNNLTLFACLFINTLTVTNVRL